MFEKKDVARFIRKFHGSEKVFTEGCCYWFAWILSARFPGGAIVYDPVAGHFLYRFLDAFWDIRGDVTRSLGKARRQQLVDWDRHAHLDPKHHDRVYAQCVLLSDEAAE